jgi:hypothetical protein
MSDRPQQESGAPASSFGKDRRILLDICIGVFLSLLVFGVLVQLYTKMTNRRTILLSLPWAAVILGLLVLWAVHARSKLPRIRLRLRLLRISLVFIVMLAVVLGSTALGFLELIDQSDDFIAELKAYGVLQRIWETLLRSDELAGPQTASALVESLLRERPYMKPDIDEAARDYDMEYVPPDGDGKHTLTAKPRRGGLLWFRISGEPWTTEASFDGAAWLTRDEAIRRKWFY